MRERARGHSQTATGRSQTWGTASRLWVGRMWGRLADRIPCCCQPRSCSSLPVPIIEYEEYIGHIVIHRDHKYLCAVVQATLSFLNNSSYTSWATPASYRILRKRTLTPESICGTVLTLLQSSHALFVSRAEHTALIY